MIGIIGAMRCEVDALIESMQDVSVAEISSVKFYRGIIGGAEVVVAEAGVGKVNAAVTAQTMILKYNTDHIINIGVAGGLNKNLVIGDIVVAEKCAEHDMDTTPLGDAPGYITGLDRVYTECDRSLVELICECAEELKIHTIVGTVVSGDQFISRDDQRKKLTEVFGGDAAEMEGAAIGHVCAMNNVSFVILRAISDGADSDSHMDFPKFCRMAAYNSSRIVKNLLVKMGKQDNAAK